MKKLIITLVCLAATTTMAAPIRVALLEFDDKTGIAPEERLGGAIRPGALAEKGVYLVSKQLVGDEGYVLIDRRDFIDQIDRIRPEDGGKPTAARPSFIQAAQSLNADVVLRGNLLSFSTGGHKVDQGGYTAEFTTLGLSVALEALDPVDGTVIAMAEGGAMKKFRQTQAMQTTLSETDILEAFNEAIAKAIPELKSALQEREEKMAARPKVKISITTDAEPALVEIDGVLVGSTPIEELEIYQGDHVLTVGKAGYQDITKRIMFEKDARIEVPMIRTKLTADEMKEVMEKMRMSVIVGEPGIVIHEIGE